MSNLFNVGYGKVRSRVKKGSKYTMSCFNCEYYYQSIGDTEEVCQNEDVLKFDMVQTDYSIYCNQWCISKRQEENKSVKSIFKKAKKG